MGVTKATRFFCGSYKMWTIPA